MKKLGLAVTMGLAVLAMSTAASAQTKGRVITLNEVTIVGRVQRPIAAVDVARIRPRITLSEVREPFLDRIEDAIYKEPF